MIKIGIRYNLLYPLMLIIFSFFRKIDSIVMNKTIDFKGSLLLTIIMFLSEFLSGLVLYIYHIKFLRRKKESKFMGIELIHGIDDISYPDSDLKIFFLIIVATLFDFIEFIIQTFYLPSVFNEISPSLDVRFRSILILCSSVGCYFLLKLPFFKHQKFSLIIIFICLIILIISEYYFVCFLGRNSARSLTYLLFLNFINNIFNSFLDIIEKYLLEYDFVNPFKMLMIEGIIGFILSFFYSFKVNPFSEIKSLEDKDSEKMILLIIFLVIYFILSGGRNSYRVTTNKLYSPMTRTLTDSILDPLLIIYYFFNENDFYLEVEENKGQNIFYFIINLITSVVIVFCSCVYNELFVLYCCDLEHDTHYEVSKRAKITEKTYELSSEDSNSNNSLSCINDESSLKSN